MTELDRSRFEISAPSSFLPSRMANTFYYVAISTKDKTRESSSGPWIHAKKASHEQQHQACSRAGYLLFLRENTLMAQRLDPDRLELRQGDPFRVAEQVGFNPTKAAQLPSRRPQRRPCAPLNGQGGNLTGFIRW